MLLNVPLEVLLHGDQKRTEHHWALLNVPLPFDQSLVLWSPLSGHWQRKEQRWALDFVPHSCGQCLVVWRKVLCKGTPAFP